MGEIKQRTLDFLITKNHVALQMMLNGWAVQDVFIEGGPDLLAIKNEEIIRIKVRYAVRGDGGCVFSSGGFHSKTFFELCTGSDFLVMVCLNENKQPTGFYVFPQRKAPKTKTVFHPEEGPYPKYKGFFGAWGF